MHTSAHTPHPNGETTCEIETDRPTCRGCTYFSALDRTTGTCHRYPPIFTGDEIHTEQHHWRFPIVLGGSWCGEFLVHS